METPFFSVNPKTNEISGIDSDILNEIVRRLEINKVEIKELTFANLLEEFNTDDSIDIAVKKNDISLLNALNKTIDDMKADGTLNAILAANGLDKSNMI